jgi:hypothetical protein
MSQKTDWFPTTRAGILAMAIVWIAVCTVKRLLWGITGVALTEFTELKNAAQAAFAIVEDASTRTAVTVAECKAAFKALEVFMRDFKRRYFIKPPLTDADFISLGLKAPDPHPSPVPAPEDVPEVEVQTPLPRTVRIRFRWRNAVRWGKPDHVHGLECRWLFADEMPLSVDDLVHSEFVTKNPLELVFDEKQRGKKLFFAVRWETGTAKKGKWSDIFYVLVT